MEVDGLDRFLRTLENSSEEFQEEARKATKKLTARVLRKVKLKTPVGADNGGTLRRTWRSKRIDDFTYQIYNNTEYAPHVEFGHRTRLGTGTSPNYKPKGRIRFVKGQYMLKKAIDETSKGKEFEFETLIENLWRE